MTFEEWFEKEFKGNPREALWTKFDLGDLRAAFDVGYEVGYKGGYEFGKDTDDGSLFF